MKMIRITTLLWNTHITKRSSIYLGYIFLVACLCAVSSNVFANELKLVKALPLKADFDANPSGLAYCQGKLLTVSDKVDGKLFEVQYNEDTAVLTEFMQLPAIPKLSSSPFPLKIWLIHLLKRIFMSDNLYDWEGIACDSSGNLYLLSESFAKVLQVKPDETVQWLDIDFYAAGNPKGLFQKDNAFAEGLTVNDYGTVYLAAERQPRGLLLSKQSSVIVHRVPTSPIAPPAPRADDFSGLTLHQGNLYSLERNASAVCQRQLSDLRPAQCWSYGHVENADEYRYTEHQYGLAEGIVFAENRLWIILDNNGSARISQPEDKRPLVFVFDSPKQ